MTKDEPTPPAGVAKVQQLRKPVIIAGETITELHWRPMRAAFARKLPAAGSMTIGDLLEVAANATGQPSAVIDQLEDDDVGELLEVVLAFLKRCRLTGEPG